MITELCAHLRNYFIRSDNDVHCGTYKITNGSISLPFMKDGQYFRIIGSLFNDGVHVYNATDLIDEEFEGEIWAMAVPSAFISISDEIDEWNKKYKDIANNPYSSESFGGYSYMKSAGVSVQGTSADISWQSVFRARLNRWRKL